MIYFEKNIKLTNKIITVNDLDTIFNIFINIYDKLKSEGNEHYSEPILDYSIVLNNDAVTKGRVEDLKSLISDKSLIEENIITKVEISLFHHEKGLSLEHKGKKSIWFTIKSDNSDGRIYIKSNDNNWGARTEEIFLNYLRTLKCRENWLVKLKGPLTIIFAYALGYILELFIVLFFRNQLPKSLMNSFFSNEVFKIISPFILGLLPSILLIDSLYSSFEPKRYKYTGKLYQGNEFQFGKNGFKEAREFMTKMVLVAVAIDIIGFMCQSLLKSI